MNIIQNKPLEKAEKKTPFYVSPFIARLYLVFSILVLLATTGLWSYLSARIQLVNADQLVNSFLFDQIASVQNALLPSAHTFLLKWPLFLFIGIKGASANLFTTATVALVVITVICLVGIIYRITKRPLLVGTLIFAVASMLLMTPTNPFTGALLPTNMAMLATRNIEYIIYIVGLIFVIRAKKLLSSAFLAGVLLLTLVISSDKLFLALSFGGALLMLAIYAIWKQWTFVRIAWHWLLATAISTGLALATLFGLNALNVTHIVGSGKAIGPYSINFSLHDIALGAIYAVIGLFTNFGANPVRDATKLSEMPKVLYEQLGDISTLSYLINGILLGISFVMVLLLLRATLIQKPKQASRPQTPVVLSAMLFASMIVAIISFIFTNHYYSADARYLNIAFFAIIIGAITYANKKTWRSAVLVSTGFVICLGIIAGVPSVLENYQQEKRAVSVVNERAVAINQALASHKVKYLVGDYWRVLPVNLHKQDDFTIAPLQNCTEYRQTLTSTNWQPDLNKHSFAYLLSFDTKLTDYPTCTLVTVEKTFGTPTVTALIAGTVDKPQEMLLFYDDGINLSDASAITPSTTPLNINNLPNTFCPSGKTIMNIVAHEDDDLLFMSPDIQANIDNDDCIRTVYLTAGDAGQDKYYWIGREEGSEAAYASMANIHKEEWVQRTVKATDSAYFTIANHPKNKKLSMIFMQLPDGNINGSGFAKYQYNSLSHMLNTTGTITSVDGQSTYTTASLEATLETIMKQYQPTTVRTLSTYDGPNFPDHSDHHMTNIITHQVLNKYLSANSIEPSTVPIISYMGYPVRLFPVNVTGPAFDRKLATFLAYSQDDPAVCHSQQDCANTPTYWGYLQRQYIHE